MNSKSLGGISAWLSLPRVNRIANEFLPTSPHMSTEDGDRRKRARKIIINPYADFAFTAIFFVEARRTECHGAASAMMP